LTKVHTGVGMAGAARIIFQYYSLRKLFLALNTSFLLPIAFLGVSSAFLFKNIPITINQRSSTPKHNPLFVSSESSNNVQEIDLLFREDVLIRTARWEDLSEVSRIIVEGLNHSPKSVLYHPRCLIELTRLQNNFHYNQTRHMMLVASHPKFQNEIVAFVDIDGREYDDSTKLPANFPPRPYLSDLFVRENSRRMGIGRALVQLCENICFEEWNFKQIYLRVESFNTQAINFYENIGYSKDPVQQSREKTEKEIGFTLSSQIQMWKEVNPIRVSPKNQTSPYT